MEQEHKELIKNYLMDEYDSVDLKNDIFVCHLEYVDEDHYITPVMFTNDDKSIGYELIATKDTINFKWEVGTVHV